MTNEYAVHDCDYYQAFCPGGEPNNSGHEMGRWFCTECQDTAQVGGHSRGEPNPTCIDCQLREDAERTAQVIRDKYGIDLLERKE